MRGTETGFSFKPQNSGLYNDQQGYYKEFKFKEGNEKLNLILLENLDVERLYYTGNVVEAQSCLKNFVSSKLTSLDIETMTYELSQLAMEHYSQQQQLKQQSSEQLYHQFLKQKEKCEKIEQIKLQHEEKKQQLKNQTKIIQEKIDALKAKTLDIGSFKCIYCNKTFREKTLLSQHVKRRHQEQLEDIKAQSELLKEENPVMKIKRLEEERKQMQEMVHLKQMQQLQRIHEREINEQKLIDQLAEKMEKDLHNKIDNAFQQNRNQEQFENQQQREQIESQQIKGTVDDMKNMFGQFMEQLGNLKQTQQEMAKLQVDQQQNINHITNEQQNFHKENQLDRKRLAEQKKQTEKQFQDKMEADTKIIVSNYVTDLANSASSQQFLDQVKFQKEQEQEKRLREQQNAMKIQNPKEVIDKDDQANIFHIGDLKSDIDSGEDHNDIEDDNLNDFVDYNKQKQQQQFQQDQGKLDRIAKFKQQQQQQQQQNEEEEEEEQKSQPKSKRSSQQLQDQQNKSNDLPSIQVPSRIGRTLKKQEDDLDNQKQLQQQEQLDKERELNKQKQLEKEQQELKKQQELEREQEKQRELLQKQKEQEEKEKPGSKFNSNTNLQQQQQQKEQEVEEEYEDDFSETSSQLRKSMAHKEMKKIGDSATQSLSDDNFWANLQKERDQNKKKKNDDDDLDF